jgi:DNA-binding PucR family transcriptional regulator
MAIGGVAWNPPLQDIIDALIKHHGVVTQAAKELGVVRQTLSVKIAETPELQAILPGLREQLVERKVDVAEETLDWVMSLKDKDVSNTLKATMFTLNNLARKRGYACNEERAAMVTSCAADKSNAEYVKIAPKRALPADDSAKESLPVSDAGKGKPIAGKSPPSPRK